jgi:hypothetical protein
MYKPENNNGRWELVEVVELPHHRQDGYGWAEYNRRMTSRRTYQILPEHLPIFQSMEKIEEGGFEVKWTEDKNQIIDRDPMSGCAVYADVYYAIPKKATRQPYTQRYERERHTEYTYYRIDVSPSQNNGESDWDFTIVDSLTDVYEILSSLDTELDDPEANLKVTVTGIGMTPAEFEEYSHGQGRFIEQFAIPKQQPKEQGEDDTWRKIVSKVLAWWEAKQPDTSSVGLINELKSQFTITQPAPKDTSGWEEVMDRINEKYATHIDHSVILKHALDYLTTNYEAPKRKV